MIADVIALNPCAKLPQKSTNARTFLGIYKINVKINVKNDPNTRLLALEQFANASANGTPLKNPPVYSINPMHDAIKNKIGRIRSFTCPCPTIGTSSASSTTSSKCAFSSYCFIFE